MSAPRTVRLLGDADRGDLEAFLRARPLDPHLLADLRSFIWNESRWWGLEENGSLEAVSCLIEGALPIPVLCAVSYEGDPLMKVLFETIEPDLPDHMLVQSPCGLDTILPHHVRRMSQPQIKMVLSQLQVGDNEIVRLGMDDMNAIQNFLDTAYRDDEEDTRFFEPYMIEAWPHVACLKSGTMVAFGGTHIFCKETGAAAIGNIVTHPASRGQGLASRITRRLCAELQREGATCIGLNVDAGNLAAQGVYYKVGFHEVWQFEEYLASRTSAL